MPRTKRTTTSEVPAGPQQRSRVGVGGGGLKLARGLSGALLILFLFVVFVATLGIIGGLVIAVAGKHAGGAGVAIGAVIAIAVTAALWRKVKP